MARRPESEAPAGTIEYRGPEFHGPGTEVAQDWERLSAYLAGEGHGLSREKPPRQFVSGMGNLNYLLHLDGEPAVLRRPPLGPIPPGANDMKREHRILSVLWQAFPLAPRAFLFCDDEGVLGAPFFIMEYRPGLVISGALPEALGGRPAISRQLTEMMVGVLAELHAVDPAAVGLDGFGRPEGFLARTVEGWSKRSAIAADGEAPPVARAISDWLRAHLVAEQTPALLHNDFKLNNIILDPKTLEPIAVVDWDQGTRGDPLFDFATFLSYWIEPDDPPAMREMGQMPTATEPSFPKRKEVVALYARFSGRDLSDFLFHRVLGMFKLCVIFMQLGQRYRLGATKDPRYARLSEVADGLLEFTHDIAQGRAF
jgi:aminoglycoside phosphotransferase (APT) family kinase protein